MKSITEVDFKSLFETLPGLYLILTTDFRIAAVSDAYLKATMTERDDVLDRNIFDVFPDNPDDKNADGVLKLRTSLNEVLRTKQPHIMAIQKYDIRKPDGVFEERYWSPLNTPFFNEKQELVLIIHHAVDVTEQRKTTEKLRAKEKEYQLLVETVKDYAMFIISPDGKVASWNSGAESIKGYKAEEIIGKPIDVFYMEEDIKQNIPQCNLQMAMQNGHFETEGWRVRKDGSTFWANTIYTALRDDSGDLYGYSKITRDISHRKQLEEKLKKSNEELEEKVKVRTEEITKSEQRFRALIENNNDIITLMDASFRLIYRSPSATRVLGWTNEDMLGVDAKRNIHPDDKAGATKIADEVLASPGKAINYKFRMRHKDGHYLWIEGTYVNLLQDKNINAIVFNFRDVTQRVEAEDKIRISNERFEMVVAATNDVIWDWDMNSNTIWRNKNYYTHLGYEENTVSSDAHSRHEGIHPEDKERVMTSIEESIKSKRHFWSEEYRYLKADKTEAIVQDNGYILYTPSGKAYRMVGAMLDITDRKHAEQELKLSFEEKQALASRMSIILNTLPANIALLDDRGNIIDVNDSWRNFADENGFMGDNYCIGDNYPEISENASTIENEDGKKVANGVRAVLAQQLNEFVYEYPCHSPEEERWFRMIVTPLKEKEYAGAVVMHIDISELRRFETERMNSKMNEQKKITQAMLTAQEKERNYIGQELHDNINQILVGTKLYLNLAGKKNQEVEQLIKYPMELISTSIEEIRLLCHKIVTPLKEHELDELIRQLLEELQQNTMMQTEFVYDIAEGVLSDELKLNV